MSDLPHQDNQALEQACRAAARQQIARYGWTATSEDDLVALMASGPHPDGAPHDPARLATFYYTLALYGDCRQVDDRERRERAFADLQHYLLRIARRRWPDLAEDVTQQALLHVLKQVEACRKPAAFLIYTAQKLRQALGEVLHARGGELPLEPAAQVEGDPLLPPLLSSEGLHTLAAALGRLPARQQEAVVLKYFAGLSDEEIGARLGLSSGNLRVLRSRGLARLRQDQALRAYFQEPGEPEL